MPMLSSDRKKYASAHRVAMDAALLAAALMLSYLEHLIPLGSLIAIPGFKPALQTSSPCLPSPCCLRGMRLPYPCSVSESRGCCSDR